MLDTDIVEAIIQLPTDEFFNTDIYTYLWVLNKNKDPQRKGRVMLINASEKFKLLKKVKALKGKKSEVVIPVVDRFEFTAVNRYSCLGQ